MGRTVYRVTGFFLSFVNFLLGIGSIIVLYYASVGAIDVFYNHRSRSPADYSVWYELIKHGWSIGFVYVVPSLTGMTASLFYMKPLMVIHFIVAIFLLFVGSFIHTTGLVAIVLYRLNVSTRAPYYNALLDGCLYQSSGESYVDERCMRGRNMLVLAVISLCLMVLAWIFNFSHIMYCAITYSNIKKTYKKRPDVEMQSIRQLAQADEPNINNGTNNTLNSSTTLKNELESNQSAELNQIVSGTHYINNGNPQIKNLNNPNQHDIDSGQPGPSYATIDETCVFNNHDSKPLIAPEDNTSRSKQNVRRPLPKKVATPKLPESYVLTELSNISPSTEQSNVSITTVLEDHADLKIECTDQSNVRSSPETNIPYRSPTLPCNEPVLELETFSDGVSIKDVKDNNSVVCPEQESFASNETPTTTHDSCEIGGNDNLAFTGDIVMD